MNPTRPKNREAWLNRDPEDHHVYIMGHLDPSGFIDGPTKVGISKNPLARLKQVQRDEAGHIVLVAQFGFWKRGHARWVEAAFHRVCAVHRLRGEWFDIQPMHVVGLMSHNLQAFAADYLGADETADHFGAYDYLNIPGALFDVDADDFRHHEK